MMVVTFLIFAEYCENTDLLLFPRTYLNNFRFYIPFEFSPGIMVNNLLIYKIDFRWGNFSNATTSA